MSLLLGASAGVQAMMSQEVNIFTGSVIAVATTSILVNEYLDRKYWKLAHDKYLQPGIHKNVLECFRLGCDGVMMTGAVLCYGAAATLIRDSSPSSEDTGFLAMSVGLVSLTAAAHACKHRMLMSEMRDLIPAPIDLEAQNQTILHRPLLTIEA